LTFFAIFFSQSRWNWWIEWRIDIFCNWDNVIEQIGFWLCYLKSDQWSSSMFTINKVITTHSYSEEEDYLIE
jgi:hypothetical protein